MKGGLQHLFLPRRLGEPWGSGQGEIKERPDEALTDMEGILAIIEIGIEL